MMRHSKTQKKALEAMNLDLFQPEQYDKFMPLPTKIHTQSIKENIQSLKDDRGKNELSSLPSIESLYRLFKHYNWFYFDGHLPKVKIEYSSRMLSAGSYTPSLKLIRLGRRYHQLFPKDLTDTLKHEMIHIQHMRHDAAFKSEAKRVGATLKAQTHPSLRKPPRYLYVCKNCQTYFPRQKRLRMASCGSCSPNGKYDGRYKLKIAKNR